MQFEKMLAPFGLLLCLAGLGMMVPALVDLAIDNRDWHVFISAAFLSGGAGAFLYLGFRDSRGAWSRRDGFLFVSLSWIVLSLAGAIPLMMAEVGLSPADAFFESVSGLTTTGSTVLSGIDRLPPGILVWRSILQWIGGVGIVVLSVFLFPFLKLGGQNLFALESYDTAEKSFARFEEHAIRIVSLYLLLTILCTVMYDALGMSFFDAVNHAMTTVSSGGFSTSDLSMGKFHSLPILWVSVLFMFLAGVPFMVLLFLASPRRRYFDVQISYFVGAIVAAVTVILIALRLRDDPIDWTTFTNVTFTVVSIVTTTGYAYQDYAGWPVAALIIVFLLTMLGGCAGSTAGGIKNFRLVVLVQLCRAAIRRLLWPNAVRSMKYGGRAMDDEIAVSVASFFLFYLATLLAGAMFLALSGHDLVTSITASATAVGNVGPGLGSLVGPAGNFSSLTDPEKIVLAVEMLLGRLEIMSVIVLLVPSFWTE